MKKLLSFNSENKTEILERIDMLKFKLLFFKMKYEKYFYTIDIETYVRVNYILGEPL